MNPFTMHAAEQSTEATEFYRASGDCICPVCGTLYRKHPYSEHRDWNGDPWLNRLCNGELVKL